VLAVLCAMPVWEAAQGKPSAQKEPQASTATAYLGSEGCRECHAETYKNFEATPHWKTTLDGRAGARLDAMHQGCESCHGPGKAHADSLGDPKKVVSFRGMKPAEVAQRCLTCHQYGEEHANFRRSAHKSGNVTCLDCHSVHHFAEKQYLLRSAQPHLCYGCHQETRAEFARPFRHRVDEKLVKCTDCHNQHGGYLMRQLRSTAAQQQICGKCHAETRGPFVFEHDPVRTEGCMACHSPHGSMTPRLLKHSQMNLLCLECHTLTTGMDVRGATGFHNQNQRFQTCTLCHVSIHGSNRSRLFLK
jgi:DmsE family decaheme c-type cytochrome